MKSFRQHISESSGTWYSAIFDNHFDLSPENHAKAKELIGKVYKKDTNYPEALGNLYSHMIDSGVNPSHPHMRTLKSIADERQEMVSETIVKRGEKYLLKTKDGSRTLGKHDTREKALAQEKAIYASKARRGES